MADSRNSGSAKSGRRRFLAKLVAGVTVVAGAVVTGIKLLPSRLLPARVTDIHPPPQVRVESPSQGQRVVLREGEEMVLDGSERVGSVDLKGGVISIEGDGVYNFERLVRSGDSEGGVV